MNVSIRLQVSSNISYSMLHNLIIFLNHPFYIKLTFLLFQIEPCSPKDGFEQKMMMTVGRFQE